MFQYRSDASLTVVSQSPLDTIPGLIAILLVLAAIFWRFGASGPNIWRIIGRICAAALFGLIAIRLLSHLTCRVDTEFAEIAACQILPTSVAQVVELQFFHPYVLWGLAAGLLFAAIAQYGLQRVQRAH